ncbi:hypothetical protein HDV00_006965 [Rhizophlyctis rosea]|nr:hypothetical protein HDV00_006965 [Rhizophlyctis rosea]
MPSLKHVRRAIANDDELDAVRLARHIATLNKKQIKLFYDELTSALGEVGLARNGKPQSPPPTPVDAATEATVHEPAYEADIFDISDDDTPLLRTVIPTSVCRILSDPVTYYSDLVFDEILNATVATLPPPRNYFIIDSLNVKRAQELKPTSQKTIAEQLHHADRLVAVVHRDNHWSFDAFDIKGGKSYFVDWLRGKSNITEMTRINSYLEVVGLGAFTFEDRLEIPQQLDGWSCGVYAAETAVRFLSKTPEDTPWPHSTADDDYRTPSRNPPPTQELTPPDSQGQAAPGVGSVVQMDVVKKVLFEEEVGKETEEVGHRTEEDAGKETGELQDNDKATFRNLPTTGFLRHADPMKFLNVSFPFVTSSTDAVESRVDFILDAWKRNDTEALAMLNNGKSEATASARELNFFKQRIWSQKEKLSNGLGDTKITYSEWGTCMVEAVARYYASDSLQAMDCAKVHTLSVELYCANLPYDQWKDISDAIKVFPTSVGAILYRFNDEYRGASLPPKVIELGERVNHIHDLAGQLINYRPQDAYGRNDLLATILSSLTETGKNAQRCSGSI